MHALVDRHYAHNTSNEACVLPRHSPLPNRARFPTRARAQDLVEAVHTFYERNIRRHFDYGPWSRKSIWRFLTEYSDQSMDRQCVENAKTVYRQIEFLRGLVATRNDATGVVEPDLRVVREIGNLAKLHSSLVGEIRKRAQQQSKA